MAKASHFMPDAIHPSMKPYNSMRENYESIKAAFRTDLMANESCMNKCNLNMESNVLAPSEKDCFR